MLYGVNAMLLVYAIQQVGRVVRGGDLLVVDDVYARLVQRHRVGRSQDTVVFQLHGFRMVHTVAIYRHVVHHRDIDDALSGLEEVGYSCCCYSHALQEAILVSYELRRPEFGHVQFLHLASRVDVSLSVLAATAYGQVLQRTAVSTHWMPLEVVQRYHEVVVLHVRTHNVVLQVGRVSHRDFDFAFLVHDVHLEVLQEAMPFDDLPVVLRRITLILSVFRGISVGGVTLHDGTLHLIYQQLDKLRF